MSGTSHSDEMKDEKITVFLADDHAVVRDGLRMVLEEQPGIRVVGGASDGRETIRLVQDLSPDVVIIDIAMPGMNGIDATREIKERCPSVQVMILSMHTSPEYIYQALRAGALGYLVKESAGKEVAEAVRMVHRGRRCLSRIITDTMVDDYIHRRDVFPAKSPLERLSRRETEILQLVVEGKSSMQIAKLIHLSPKTVETYRSRLMRKLDIHDLPTLVKFAIEHGLTPLE